MSVVESVTNQEINKPAQAQQSKLTDLQSASQSTFRRAESILVRALGTLRSDEMNMLDPIGNKIMASVLLYGFINNQSQIDFNRRSLETIRSAIKIQTVMSGDAWREIESRIDCLVEHGLIKKKNGFYKLSLHDPTYREAENLQVIRSVLSHVQDTLCHYARNTDEYRSQRMAKDIELTVRILPRADSANSGETSNDATQPGASENPNEVSAPPLTPFDRFSSLHKDVVMSFTKRLQLFLEESGRVIHSLQQSKIFLEFQISLSSHTSHKIDFTPVCEVFHAKHPDIDTSTLRRVMESTLLQKGPRSIIRDKNVGDFGQYDSQKQITRGDIPLKTIAKCLAIYKSVGETLKDEFLETRKELILLLDHAFALRSVLQIGCMSGLITNREFDSLQQTTRELIERSSDIVLVPPTKNLNETLEGVSKLLALTILLKEGYGDTLVTQYTDSLELTKHIRLGSQTNVPLASLPPITWKTKGEQLLEKTKRLLASIQVVEDELGLPRLSNSELSGRFSADEDLSFDELGFADDHSTHAQQSRGIQTFSADFSKTLINLKIAVNDLMDFCRDMITYENGPVTIWSRKLLDLFERSGWSNEISSPRQIYGQTLVRTLRDGNQARCDLRFMIESLSQEQYNFLIGFARVQEHIYPEH
jgi:hypothetical protein